MQRTDSDMFSMSNLSRLKVSKPLLQLVVLLWLKPYKMSCLANFHCRPQTKQGYDWGNGQIFPDQD